MKILSDPSPDLVQFVKEEMDEPCLICQQEGVLVGQTVPIPLKNVWVADKPVFIYMLCSEHAKELYKPQVIMTCLQSLMNFNTARFAAIDNRSKKYANQRSTPA